MPAMFRRAYLILITLVWEALSWTDEADLHRESHVLLGRLNDGESRILEMDVICLLEVIEDGHPAHFASLAVLVLECPCVAVVIGEILDDKHLPLSR